MKGTTTLVSLPTTEDPILQEPSRVLLHQSLCGAFLNVGGLAGQAVSTGQRTGSCCCSCCRSAISVGELGGQVPSNCLSAGQLCYTAPSASRQLLYTVCRCLQTAPLHCLLVGHDSSTSNPVRSASFCRGVGWGVEGKQVGSMDEEPQVRGCYNITFICTPTNQETV